MFCSTEMPQMAIVSFDILDVRNFNELCYLDRFDDFEQQGLDSGRMCSVEYYSTVQCRAV